MFEVPSCQEQSVDIRFLKNIIDFPRAVAINSSEQRSHSVEVSVQNYEIFPMIQSDLNIYLIRHPMNVGSAFFSPGARCNLNQLFTSFNLVKSQSAA